MLGGILVAGCSVLGPGRVPRTAQLDGRHLTIPVVVRNDNMQDVTVYVLHGGLRTRIGTATAAATSALSFPAHFAGPSGMIRLSGVPTIGGRSGFRRSVLSEPIAVYVGERVVWSLEPDLARSTIAVYDNYVPTDTAQSPARSDSLGGNASLGRRGAARTFGASRL